MSLEDNFHKNNLTQQNKKSLTAKFELTSEDDISILKTNIMSERFSNLLLLINKNNNLSELSMNSGDIVLKNYHPAFNVDISKNVFLLEIDHSMIGGSLLVKLLEAIINSREREFQNTSILKSMLYTIQTIPSLYTFAVSKKVDLNNRDKKKEIYYYSQMYTIHKMSNVSRLSVAYHTIFNDALIALNKETIIVGIPIPFENCLTTNNNVGIVVLEYKKNMSLETTHELLKKVITQAYVTNLYNLYGAPISNIIGINNSAVREKIDIICSTFVSTSNCLSGRFTLHPKINITENAYLSIHIHLLGDKKRADVCVNVSTHSLHQNWKKIKYLNNPL